ncbi:glycosyltransferase involved in cell wall biosynthesis [Dyadobacter jejuensis]|uniref:Glycosyltransferase involved in cell wall biosynthesis n=1 Tax=Dyadobacter jejuensis TaxID=1082580 RepID=A0A316ATK6_9BACT|nr:glycosyltransferase family 2 protein [Dyadobacter jejuensis]PWJ60619.1 glycosyltransferase involved in cell wall biosynthesis [Dyadobacter jejuensis]
MKEPSTPKLTIITITFQAEKYLERTLQSVEKAWHKLENKSDLEYILVDGASTDHTLAIASRYAHLLSRVYSEPDEGLYDAMNKGQQWARGTYIWFLNAGDSLFDSHTLSQVWQAMKTEPDILYGDAMLVRDDGREIGLRSAYTPHKLPTNLSWRHFATGMKVCHQSFITKKKLASPYLVHNLSADIDWEINCLKKANNIEYLPVALCRYLVGGLSVQNHRKSLIDRFIVLRHHFGLIPTLFNHLFILVRAFLFTQKNGKYW